MNDNQLDILRSIGLAALLMSIACGIASMSGCASVQTVGTKQIDAVIDSGILDEKHEVTASDKKVLRSAFEAGRSDIVAAERDKVVAIKAAEKQRDEDVKKAESRAEAAEKRAVAAEKKADSNAAWASRGKWGAGILIGIVVLCVAGAVLRFLGKIPFI